MPKYIKKFNNTINEHVVETDGIYRVSGIKVKKSVITSYKRKVKETTGKDLGNIYSDSQIAEELMHYISEKYLDAETIPVSALIGGEEGLEEIKDEDENTINPDGAAIEPDSVDDGNETPAENIETPNQEDENSDDSFESVSDNENPNPNPDNLPM